MERIVIPDSVKVIEEATFYECASLRDVVIPDSVVEIGTSAFWGCTSLKEISIPDSVKRIWSYAFWGCTSLEEVIIPDSVDVFGFLVFRGCESLRTVVIPDSFASRRQLVEGNTEVIRSSDYRRRREREPRDRLAVEIARLAQGTPIVGYHDEDGYLVIPVEYDDDYNDESE